MSDKGPERELPLAQRSLVDNCFEEGQYEYGIDVLDKFRGQGYKPPPLHIRQLVYISLYPLPEKVIERVDFPPSPQKMQFQRQKEDLWPKPTSRPLAVALLKAFLGTSSPQCLMRALPFHIYINSEGVRDVDPFCNEEISEDYSEDNSPLKNELRTMQSLKDCWGLLKNGFVKRKQLDRARVDDSAASHQSDDAIVGPYAWPVLEWLIKIFEKDEQQGKKQGHAPYSALLLTQIPEPRTKQGPRCDAEMPLRVAFACFSFASHTADRPEDMHTSSEAPCDLGARLISLLVNLTLTQPPLLSPSHLLHSLTTLRLPNLLLHPLHAFFSTFSTRHAFFKVAVLERYISTSSRRDDETMLVHLALSNYKLYTKIHTQCHLRSAFSHCFLPLYVCLASRRRQCLR
ncbi:hypothetical protein K439DRAFT_771748 [Ramaria rubella]|nr:hypothetical protein K439DRAFT_771748 [Ramaria rubella]